MLHILLEFFGHELNIRLTSNRQLLFHEQKVFYIMMMMCNGYQQAPSNCNGMILCMSSRSLIHNFSVVGNFKYYTISTSIDESKLYQLSNSQKKICDTSIKSEHPF